MRWVRISGGKRLWQPSKDEGGEPAGLSVVVLPVPVGGVLYFQMVVSQNSKVNQLFQLETRVFVIDTQSSDHTPMYVSSTLYLEFLSRR